MVRLRHFLLPGAAAAVVLGLGVAMRHGPGVGRLGFALGWLWGLVVLAAMVGWGRACNRILLPGDPRGWGLRAAWGLALTVAVGGVLNLVGLISPAVVFVYLAAGAGLLVWRPAIRRNPNPSEAVHDPVVWLLFAVVAGLALVQYSSLVAGTVDLVYSRPAFDLHDDFQAYLVFPKRMLETGSLGREPFEARRALSLGGQSFLQALVLAARPMRTLHLVDQGLALLVILGLILGTGRRRRLGPRFTALAALLALSLPHLEMRGNTSAVLTGVVFLLAWFFEELGEPAPEEHAWRRWILTALLAAGACAVKSTFIPFAAFFFALTSAPGLAGPKRRRELARGTVITATVAAALLPWMISVHQSSGTFLYPLLGRGYLGPASTHGFPAVHGDFAVPTVAVVRMLLKQLVPLLPVFLLLVFVRDSRPRRPATALVLASALTIVALVLAGDPSLNHTLKRYAFPMMTTALLGMAVAALEDAAHRPHPLRTAGAVAVMVAALFSGRSRFTAMVDQMIVNIDHGLAAKPLVPETDRHALRRLQEALPPGATVLATLRTPFLLDSRRHRILIMSLPGFCSPPPGLPVEDGAEAVASYLLDHGVRYLAYGGARDLSDLLKLTEKDIRSRYPHSKMRWAMLIEHRLY